MLAQSVETNRFTLAGTKQRKKKKGLAHTLTIRLSSNVFFFSFAFGKDFKKHLKLLYLSQLDHFEFRLNENESS